MRRIFAGAFAFLLLLLAGCGGGGDRPTIHVRAVGHNHSHLTRVLFGGPLPGSPAPGDILTTTSGRWSGSPTGFTYLWQDCDSAGGSCTTASGSPTNTTRYVIVAADVGFTIRVKVTASYAGHPDSSVQSQPTRVVSGGAPGLSSSPTVAGTPQQGLTLTASNGTWTNSPTSFSYQWLDCTGSCVNATGPTVGSCSPTSSCYVPQAYEAGPSTPAKLEVQVTASNGSGSSSPAVSPQTASVGTMPANNGYNLCNPTTNCSSIGFPSGGANTNITATQSINTTVTNATYTVTTCPTATSPAVQLGPSGVLNNVVINMGSCNNDGVRSSSGVNSCTTAPCGTVNGVEVIGTAGSSVGGGCSASSGDAFRNVKNFQGIEYATGVFQGLCLNTGSGYSQASGSEIIAYGTGGTSGEAESEVDGITGGTFNGAIIADWASSCGGTGEATGVAFGFAGGSSGPSGGTFDTLIGNSNPGYGIEIYGQTHNVTVNNAYVDGIGDGNCPQGDPGVSLGGGTHNMTIQNLAAKQYTFGLISGEDVSPPPHDNHIGTLYSLTNPYSCVGLDRGAYNNVIGDVGGTLCKDSGGAQNGGCTGTNLTQGPNNNWCGSITIEDRMCTAWSAGPPPTGTGCQYENSGAPNGLPLNYNSLTEAVPPYNNTISGLYESGISGGTHTPNIAVYFGPYTGSRAALVWSSNGGATGSNTVTGVASSFNTSKTYDASCTSPPLGGTCGNSGP